MRKIKVNENNVKSASQDITNSCLKIADQIFFEGKTPDKVAWHITEALFEAFLDTRFETPEGKIYTGDDILNAIIKDL